MFFLFTSFASAQNGTTVYFPFDSYKLHPDAEVMLDSLASKSTSTSVDIYGHCDQLGSKSYNYKLSEKRANTVRDYLVAKGWDASKIRTIQGFGEDRPVINKLDETSRQANRRVTIVSADQTVSVQSNHPPANAPADKPVVEKQPKRDVRPKEKLVDEITDTTMKAGQNIVLRNINFYGGSHRLLPTSYDALQELLEAMQKIPTLVIEIQGHICCISGENDGMDNDTGEPFLSLNRARAIYGFLLRNGIDKNRMTYKGFGHKYPIYPIERNEAEMTANRRVEIKIIRK
jgi:outer membrane protein OmpA-like peptidoglycan-associated protein